MTRRRAKLLFAFALTVAHKTADDAVDVWPFIVP